MIRSSYASVRSSSKLTQFLTSARCSSSNSEYLASPVYPPILDLSPKLVKQREDQVKYDKMQALDTVEEKLFCINLAKYYGWNCVHLREGQVPVNFLPFVQRVTRTKLLQLKEGDLEKHLPIKTEESQEVLERIRQTVQEAIIFELRGKRSSEENTTEAKRNSEKCIVEKINSILVSTLASSHPHILSSTVDYDPRVEAFWKVGGFHPSDELYLKRSEEKSAITEDKEELVDHWVQSFSKPFIQLRGAFPLPELPYQLTEPAADADLPEFRFDPTCTFGLKLQRRHGTNLPGFWPGDVNEFGLVSYSSRSFLEGRPPQLGEKEHEDALHSQAVISAFSLAHSQAAFQGFSTFHEVTYPFVTQNVMTDGRLFSIYLYQMNTVKLHEDFIDNNPKYNVCLCVPTAPLYQELKGNQFEGWNDLVLLRLISLYLNTPKRKEMGELKPHVNPERSLLAHIKEDERRVWLHDQFRHMYSGRPRHRLGYQIYDWERIYKIKFQTRPQEARMRPFELDRDPTEERKYYDHMPPYIPRKFRPRKKSWIGWRAKFAKTYYPEIW